MMKRTLIVLAGLALLTSACSDDDTAEAAPTVVIDGETAAVGGDAETEDRSDDESGVETDDEVDGDVGAEPSEEPASSDEELALEFARCMRDNGMPDWQDPLVNADGSIDLVPGDPGEAGIDPDDPALEEAIEACGELIDGADFAPGTDLDPAELEDDLLAMAQCLRDLGYDVDDPDISGGLTPGQLSTLFGPNFDPTDPANGDDIQACQLEVFGPDGPPGPGQGGN